MTDAADRRGDRDVPEDDSSQQPASGEAHRDGQSRPQPRRVPRPRTPAEQLRVDRFASPRILEARKVIERRRRELLGATSTTLELREMLAAHADQIRSESKGLESVLERAARELPRFQSLTSPAPARLIEDLQLAVTAYEAYNTERLVQREGLPGPVAELLRSQSRISVLARQLRDRSLTASLMAAQAAAAAAPLTPPDHWRPILAEMRRTMAAAPSLADYSALQRHYAAQQEWIIPAALFSAMVRKASAESVEKQSSEEARRPVTEAEANEVIVAATEALATVDPAALEAARESDEWLFGVLAWVHQQVSRVRGIDEKRLTLILTVLAWVIPSPLMLVSGRRDGQEIKIRHEQIMQVEEQQAALQENILKVLQREHDEHTLRYRAVGRAVLRDGPSSKSMKIAALPAGQEFVQRERFGRWLHVEIVGHELSGLPPTGWVYDRGVELLQMGVTGARVQEARRVVGEE